MNKLVIDTSNNKEITVGLVKDRKKFVIKKQSDTWKAQMVLPLIHELLEKHNMTIHQVDEIEVNPGPGSFTGLRVGVAIANTLGAWLKIPINKEKIGSIIIPKYK